MILEISFEILGCLKVITEIFDEATFFFHKEGLRIYEMSKDGVKSVLFDYKFKCKLEDEFTIATKPLAKILKIIKEQDKIFLSADKEKTTIKFEIKSEGFERTFSLAKMMPDADKAKVGKETFEKLEFNTTFTIAKPVLARIVTEAEMFNDFCTISATEEGKKINLTAEDETGKGYTSDIDVSFEKKGEARAEFLLENIEKILKAETQTFQISAGVAYPMKFFFCGEEYDFTYIVAPLVVE